MGTMTNCQFLITNERGNDQDGRHAALSLWHWSLVMNWELSIGNWQVLTSGEVGK